MSLMRDELQSYFYGASLTFVASEVELGQ